MTKNDMEKFLMKYLEEKDPSYNDIISDLTSTIQNYYDNREEQKKKDEARKELAAATINYFKIITGEPLNELETQAAVDAVTEIINELEATTFKGIKTTKGNRDLIKEFIAGIM